MIKKLSFIVCSIFLFLQLPAKNGNIATVVNDLKTQSVKLLDDTEETLQDVETRVDLPDEEFVEIRTQKVRSEEVSPDWKKEVAFDFHNDIAFLRQIIIKGEGRKEEQQDFSSLFDELKKWFESTLKKTKRFFDSNYNVLRQKKLSIARVVKAQKVANEIIEQHSEHIGFNKNLIPQIRLLVLYEINSAIQNEVEAGTIDELDMGVTKEQIEKIIRQSTEQVEKERKEFGVDLAVVQNLVFKLKQIKRELETQDEMLEQLERLIKNKFIKKDKKILELELLLKNQSKLSKRKMEGKFKGKLKDLKKTSLGFELKLKKNEKDAQLKLEAKLQERLSEIKKILIDKGKASLEFELLLREAREQRDGLQEKVDKLMDQVGMDKKQAEEASDTAAEEEIDIEQNAIINEDKRLADLLKDIEMVEGELEKEKKAVLDK